MAKFIYRMQNILDIKYKLEETAKQEYTVARLALTEEEEKLEGLLARKNSYYEKYQEALIGNLDFLTINELSNANTILDNMIENQNEVIKKKSDHSLLEKTGSWGDVAQSVLRMVREENA